VDLYTQAGRGTVISVQLWRTGHPGNDHHSTAMEVDGLSVPRIGETDCGDAWAARHSSAGCTILVVDGLGHGPLAADASRAAVDSFVNGSDAAPVEQLDRIHRALYSTRGAAGAVAVIDLQAKQVRFAGVGNISASIVRGQDTRHLVSMNGTLGHEARNFREFIYDWDEAGTLIMHSDGIATRWELSNYPGLMNKPPGLAAALLYRDLNRGRDDATVVIARERRAS
jgi:hypothetical protein